MSRNNSCSSQKVMTVRRWKNRNENEKKIFVRFVNFHTFQSFFIFQQKKQTKNHFSHFFCKMFDCSAVWRVELTRRKSETGSHHLLVENRLLHHRMCLSHHVRVEQGKLLMLLHAGNLKCLRESFNQNCWRQINQNFLLKTLKIIFLLYKRNLATNLISFLISS